MRKCERNRVREGKRGREWQGEAGGGNESESEQLGQTV